MNSTVEQYKRPKVEVARKIILTKPLNEGGQPTSETTPPLPSTYTPLQPKYVQSFTSAKEVPTGTYTRVTEFASPPAGSQRVYQERVAMPRQGSGAGPSSIPRMEQSNSQNDLQAYNSVDVKYGLTVKRKNRGMGSIKAIGSEDGEERATAPAQAETINFNNTPYKVKYSEQTSDRQQFQSYVAPGYYQSQAPTGNQQYTVFSDYKSPTVLFASNIIPTNQPIMTGTTATVSSVNYSPAITAHTVIHQIQTSVQPNFSAANQNIIPQFSGHFPIDGSGQSHYTQKEYQDQNKHTSTANAPIDIKQQSSHVSDQSKQFSNVSSQTTTTQKVQTSSQTKTQEHVSESEKAQEFEITIDGVGKYKGTMINGNMHGHGSLFDTNGKLVYKGDFVNNEFEGHGVIYNHEMPATDIPKFSNEDVLMKLANYWENYEGEFKASKFQGVGTLIFKNNFAFLGEFSDGKIDGYGLLSMGGSRKIIGLWKQNALVEQI